MTIKPNIAYVIRLAQDSATGEDLKKSAARLKGMFGYSQFNGDISKWNISKVTEMGAMFIGSKFDKDISNWNIGHIGADSRKFMFKDR